MKETEIKILNINPARIRRILKENNAVLIKKVLQRNEIFTNQGMKGTIIRVRTEGRKVTLTTKSPLKIIKNHKIRNEASIPIDNINGALEFIKILGYHIDAINEIKREYYKINNTQVEILTMPGIPPFLEIEGTQKNIELITKKLGYSKKDYKPLLVFNYYKIPKNLTFKK